MLTESEAEVLREIRQSAAWAEVEARKETELEAGRAAAVQAIVKATDDRARKKPIIDKKLAAAVEKTNKAREALQTAQAEVLLIQRENGDVESTYRAAVSRGEATLRQTAPAEVDEVRRRIDKAMNSGRAAFQHVDLLPVPLPYTDPKPAKERSNGATVTTLIESRIAGIRACDGLIVAPITRAAIRAQLAEIVNSIPRHDSAALAFTFELDAAAKPPMFERVETRRPAAHVVGRSREK